MSVLPCFVQRRRQAELTQTPKAGLPQAIWIPEGALGLFVVCVLSQTPSAHPHCQMYIVKAAQEPWAEFHSIPAW